ncbi:hypothetical protein PR048_021086 [Dryococelus australis]|uniref:HAT C-terminal dimerisation domain-containing protein n=1 Tax=Dryococelus australis TaxID=614101 RepID=A0ABQ9GX90_9NEOP|nr:hypothetical protein PR048_021086 [Dryococelus australis]
MKKHQIVHQLLTNVLKREFILSLFISAEILTHTLPLCKYLQKVECDLCTTCDPVESVLSALDIQCHNAGNNFESIFERANDVLSEVGGEIASNIPRRVARQRDRDNVPAATAEEYYRKPVYIPFIDYVRSHLSDRFANHRDIVTSLQEVVPSKLASQTEVVHLKRCIELYSGVFPDANSLHSELDTWKSKWLKKKLATERTSNSLEAYFHTVPELYPNICKLLEILATLSVSTAAAERSFSTMKWVKTYLRNSTSDTRLTGLALLSVHKQMKIEPKYVVDQFSLKPSRTKLIL